MEKSNSDKEKKIAEDIMKLAMQLRTNGETNIGACKTLNCGTVTCGTLDCRELSVS
jgi:hypothetical protein